MKRSRRISVIMHKLLIENGLDGFTVLEARDLWLSVDKKSSNSNEARKKVYRAIFNFERKNWLRFEGAGREKRYFQTEHFKKLPEYEALNHHPRINKPITDQDYSILLNECNEYKGELEIVLGEVNEYQSIASRFPKLKSRLAPIHQQAKERAALLLGKINALTTVLQTVTTGGESC
ncbi:hypothetical protein [Vibrio owensii]|uniref:hypothetical protein n=1 Tax=Vibrio owensii TaxID=696485 RepID=UPI003DA1C6BD